MTILSSETLKGSSVSNPAGEDLGRIEDFMLNVENGEVGYAVLSFGGFLGMGDKLFAVPMRALHLDRDEKHFVLNMDKERLKDAPGFDKDHWPDMADPKFSSQLFTYYGIN